MYKIHPKTHFVGQIYQYLPSCQSTNDEASALLAHSDVVEGLLIATDNQTDGRGQRGNTWEAQPAQNLTFSLLFKPTFLTATEQFWLNMAVSLGVHDTIAPLVYGDCRVKWPNDLYIGFRKTGGILIENTLQGYNLAWSVVGIGLNVNQTEFSYSTATSLQQEAPLPNGYDRAGLLAMLCEKLEKRYLQLRAGQRQVLKADYMQTLYRYQRETRFSTDDRTFMGMIIDVDETGRLVVAEAGRTHRFGFKEVSFVPMTSE